MFHAEWREYKVPGLALSTQLQEKVGCFRLLVTHVAWGSQTLSCVLLEVTAKDVFAKVDMDAIILLNQEIGCVK